MLKKLVVVATFTGFSFSAFAQGEEITYEVPVKDPALQPFATDVITDASLRKVIKVDPRRPERRREFIKLDYTMPTTLVGKENLKVEMRGPIPTAGEAQMKLSSTQGTATCNQQVAGTFDCRMEYDKLNLPIDAELAAVAIENSGLTPEAIAAKKAVQASFSGEPIGILHGLRLRQSGH